MRINDPDFVAELRELYRNTRPRWSRTMRKRRPYILASPEGIRFGLAENLYGIDEIAAFGKGRSLIESGADDQPARHCDLRSGLR
jgi:hypothetical protein